MEKKQSPPPPNPHSSRKASQNQMVKKQQSPPPNNPNLTAKKQAPRPSAPPSSSSEDEESSSASNDQEPIIKKPNTQTPTGNPQEETGYETESSDDEDGEEVNQPATKRSQPMSTAAAIPALKPCDERTKLIGKDDVNNGDEESESDSSSDEDEEPVSNPKKAQAISMTAATPVLKPCDGGDKPNGKGNTSCKPLFQRIWTLEDEIVILKAITAFEVKHGPIKINLTGIRPFHDFIKNSLSLKVSDSQLSEKVSRLRKKYNGRVNSGKTIRFASAHDKKVHELSKKIWGTGSSENTESKKVAKSKRAVAVPGNDGTGSGSLKRKYPFLTSAMASSVPADLLETVVDPENARHLEVIFKNQKLADIKNKRCEMQSMIDALDMVSEDIEKWSTE